MRYIVNREEKIVEFLDPLTDPHELKTIVGMYEGFQFKVNC